jgi:hypothetical protein
VNHSKGIGGEPIGHAHSNPLFDTREYEVKFLDGTLERYATNFIADKMYAQVDNEGNMFQLLLVILDHKKDGTAVNIVDGMITSVNGMLGLEFVDGQLNYIFLEVSLVSQYQVNPRIGQLEVLYHVFAYLKNHLDMGRIVYDSLMPEIKRLAFSCWRLEGVYGDVQEEMPPKQMPKVKGNPVIISVFVDVKHAGNVVMRQSHTGIILYVENTLIVWYTKWQNTVELAMFGSEFLALRICSKELIVAMHYKLRMFGVLIDGPANAFVIIVVKNASIPESMLVRKHNAINCHAVREAVAAGIMRVGKEDGEMNLADLLMKVIVRQKRWDFCFHLFC